MKRKRILNRIDVFKLTGMGSLIVICLGNLFIILYSMNPDWLDKRDKHFF